jgi:hypothetical protein
MCQLDIRCDLVAATIIAMAKSVILNWLANSGAAPETQTQ